MKLKTILNNTDFVPILKKPRYWVSSETLKFGSILDIEPELGHMLMAVYPGAFQVVSYEEREKQSRRVKKMDEETIVEA
jgi:hypothetical protein